MLNFRHIVFHVLGSSSLKHSLRVSVVTLYKAVLNCLILMPGDLMFNAWLLIYATVQRPPLLGRRISKERRNFNVLNTKARPDFRRNLGEVQRSSS